MAIGKIGDEQTKDKSRMYYIPGNYENANNFIFSGKGKQLIKRVYRIMLGEEDIPTSERRNKIMKGNTYSDKVMQTSIYNVNNDKNR